jgi:hypothetical protein
VVTRIAAAVRWLVRASPLLATLWATAFVFLLRNDPFLHGPLDGDESFFVWCGWSILKGLVPYRDFIEFKPPMVFLTHALALKLHGFDEFQYRTFFAYFPLASLLALQLSLLSRGVDKWLALALTIACTYLWVNPAWHDVALTDSESIGLTYYLFGIACLLARTRLGNRLQYLAGLFFACTIFSKEPYVPCVGMTWIGGFFLQEPGAPGATLNAQARAYARRTLAGGLFVLAALCLYLIPTGGMRAYLAMMASYSRLYRDPVQSYCVALGRVHPTVPLNDLYIAWRDTVRPTFVNSTTLGYLVPLGATSIVLIYRRSRPLFGAVVVALASSIWAAMASNCLWDHYYVMTMAGLFFALAVGLDSLTPYFDAAGPDLRNVLRVALLGGVLAHCWAALDTAKDLYGTRPIPLFDAFTPMPGILETVAQYTTPDDTIVTTGWPSLYMQTNRLNGIRESTSDNEVMGFYEGNTDEEKLSGIRAELLRTKPKLIILDPTPSPARKTRFLRALWGPFLEEFHYTEIRPMVWLRPD